MTLVEAIVVIFVIAFLVLMILPAIINPPHHHGAYVNCINNLKQLGLAYRIWEGDNGDKYPMERSVTNGGTMELLGGPDAWKTFQVMSNELSTPKILFCPQDSGHAGCATNFGDDLKNKISYFIGLDASEANPNLLMSGDDHFLVNNAPVKPGLVEMTANTSIAWGTNRHVSVETHKWVFKKVTGVWGNIVLADGSVQSVSNPGLTNWLQKTGLATNRLAIP